jgi:uncharacterized protein (DUF2147 family)
VVKHSQSEVVKMYRGAILTGVFLSLIAGFVFAGDETGVWKRPNGDLVDVKVVNNTLMCTINAGKRKGFEMCHGMTQQQTNVWKGKSMKHPAMPKFMTFNGTVTINANSLEIKGCVAGNGMCDKEKWSKIQ